MQSYGEYMAAIVSIRRIDHTKIFKNISSMYKRGCFTWNKNIKKKIHPIPNRIFLINREAGAPLEAITKSLSMPIAFENSGGISIVSFMIFINFTY